VLDWTSGTFLGHWTNQGTIRARDTGGVRHWGADVVFTNANLFEWQSGEMTLGSNAQIVNHGTYRAVPRAGTVFNWTSGPARPTFTNRGRFIKAAELSEPLHVGDVHFVNYGTIEVQSFVGVLNFNGPATFEAGSRFEGRETVRVSHDATFRGAFFSGTKTSIGGVLELAAGRFTGMEATMTGSVLWTGGTLADRWTNAGRLDIFSEFGRPTKTIDGGFINVRDMA
jgi:hypothetical protein